MVLLLNGVTSSGKSTISSNILRLTTDPFVYFNVDFLIPSLLPHEDSFRPASKIGNNFDREYVRKLDVDLYKRIYSKGNSIPMYELVRILEEIDLNVIVDTIIFDLNDFIRFFNVRKTYLIKIYCSIEELIKREKIRKDRKTGNVKKQYDLVHNNKIYDFKVNTHQNTAEQCAKLIIDYTHHNQPFALQKWQEVNY